MRPKLFDYVRGQKPGFYLFLILLAGLIAGVSCSSGPDFDEPPDIRYGEDSCERCLMIINEARFAAAYVTDAGETRRFDDIGGMVAYIEEISEDVAVFWVHDFDTEEWLKAEEAFYVESQQQTPMGFGIIAFADQQRATQWASENDGLLLSFDDLFG
jgi:copper chaperone NosL